MKFRSRRARRALGIVTSIGRARRLPCQGGEVRCCGIACNLRSIGLHNDHLVVAFNAAPADESQGEGFAGRISEGGGQAFDAHLFIGLQRSSKLVDNEEVRNLLHIWSSWLDMPNLSGQGRSKA
eukprot:3466295-Prymnesium_polylepis.2